MFEDELSFAATISDLPRVKQALLDRAGREHAAPTILTTTYFDTAESKLKRQGLSLCVRKQRGRYIQTVRAEDATGTVSPASGEWEDEITGECPDLHAQNSRAHLPEAIGEAELRPLFTTLVRHAVVMLAPDDLTEIEVALDEGEIQIAGSGTAEPVCEVKLEHKRGDPAAIYEIGLGLLDVAPLRIEVRSKVERGYNLLEGTVDKPRAAHPPPADLKAEMTVEEVLQRIGRECLATVFRNQPAALARVPDGVHQMRVVVRRLRSALTAVKRMLPADQYECVSRELKWLAGILGPARNWDVLSSSIIAPVGTALRSPHDLQGLYGVAERERQLAHEQARAAIQSARYTTAALKLSRWFASRGWRDQRVSEQSALLMAPIGGMAPALIARRYKKAKEATDGFEALTPRQRHQVRIEIKKLRYTIELLESLFAEDKVAGFARRLKPLQDDLGHANDVRVANDLLAELRVSDNAAVITRAAGVVLGWHHRGLANHERKLLKHVRRFQHARKFW